LFTNSFVSIQLVFTSDWKVLDDTLNDGVRRLSGRFFVYYCEITTRWTHDAHSLKAKFTVSGARGGSFLVRHETGAAKGVSAFEKKGLIEDILTNGAYEIGVGSCCEDI
jgi:hypothetical protein